jgi:hypothetical protein
MVKKFGMSVSVHSMEILLKGLNRLNEDDLWASEKCAIIVYFENQVVLGKEFDVIDRPRRHRRQQ